MARLATITIGHSDYDPRLRAILDDSGLEPQEFEGLDYFSYLPFLVIAGASVAPLLHLHGDHSHFEGATIDVPDEQVEMFLHALPQVLAMIAGAED